MRTRDRSYAWKFVYIEHDPSKWEPRAGAETLMLRFVIRRLLSTIPMVLVVVSLTWGLIRLAPGSFYTGERGAASGNRTEPPGEVRTRQTWYVQYGKHDLPTRRVSTSERR